MAKPQVRARKASDGNDSLAVYSGGSSYIGDETPDQLVQDGRADWLRDVPLALLDTTKAGAEVNAKRAAQTLAEVASVGSAGDLCVVGWSQQALADRAGCTVDQWRAGDRALQKADMVRASGPRKNRTYTLTHPDRVRGRRAYTEPPTRADDTEVVLNDDQQALASNQTAYLDAPWNATTKPFITHGYAGTGKTQTTLTTLKSHYGIPHNERVVYLAPTGQAAAVMRRNGVDAKTIHRALYRPTNETDDSGSTVFIKKTSGHDLDWLLAADVVVVDEASMVNTDTAEWIVLNSKRVIPIGDPLQLRPVRGESAWCGPNTTPDYELTQVMRYDEQSKIGRLATALRTPTWQWRDLAPYRTPGTAYDPNDYDAVIVWRNVDRWTIIDLARGALGRPKGLPVAGDIIMFTHNHIHPRRLSEWEDYAGPDDCYNGQQSTVLDVLGRETINNKITYTYSDPKRTVRENSYDVLHLLVRDHDTWMPREVSVHAHGFRGGVEHERSLPQQGSSHRNKPILNATFGHVLTCHKAQGAGFDRVLVIDPTEDMVYKPDDETRSWMYTAVTRAVHTLDIAKLSQVKGFESIRA